MTSDPYEPLVTALVAAVEVRVSAQLLTELTRPRAVDATTPDADRLAAACRDAIGRVEARTGRSYRGSAPAEVEVAVLLARSILLDRAGAIEDATRLAQLADASLAQLASRTGTPARSAGRAADFTPATWTGYRAARSPAGNTPPPTGTSASYPG